MDIRLLEVTTSWPGAEDAYRYDLVESTQFIGKCLEDRLSRSRDV